MSPVTFCKVLIAVICLSQICSSRSAHLNSRRSGIKEKRQSNGVSGGYASSSLNPQLSPVYTAPRTRGSDGDSENEVDMTTTTAYEDDEPDREEEGTSEDYQFIAGTTMNPEADDEDMEEKSGGYGSAPNAEEKVSGGYGSGPSAGKVAGGYGSSMDSSSSPTRNSSPQPMSQEPAASGSGGYDYTPTRQPQQSEEQKGDEMMMMVTMKTTDTASRPTDQQQIENFNYPSQTSVPSGGYESGRSSGSRGNYQLFYNQVPSYMENLIQAMSLPKSGSGGYGSSVAAVDQGYSSEKSFRSDAPFPRQDGSPKLSSPSSKPTTFYGVPNEIIPQSTSYLPPSSSSYQTPAIDYRPMTTAYGAPISANQLPSALNQNFGTGYYYSPQPTYAQERPQEDRQSSQAYFTAGAQPPRQSDSPSSPTPVSTNAVVPTPYANPAPKASQPQQQQEQSQFSPQARDSTEEVVSKTRNGQTSSGSHSPQPSTSYGSQAPSGSSNGRFQLEFQEFHDNDNVVDAALIQKVQQIIEEHERQQKELKEKLRREYEASEAAFFGNQQQNQRPQYGPPAFQTQPQQQYSNQQTQTQVNPAPASGNYARQQYNPPQPPAQPSGQYGSPQFYSLPPQHSYQHQSQNGQQQYSTQVQHYSPQSQQYQRGQEQEQNYQSAPQPGGKYSPAPQPQYGPVALTQEAHAGQTDGNLKAELESQQGAQSVGQNEKGIAESLSNGNLDSNKVPVSSHSDTRNNENAQVQNEYGAPNARQQNTQREDSSKRFPHIEYQKAILTDHFVETLPVSYNGRSNGNNVGVQQPQSEIATQAQPLPVRYPSRESVTQTGKANQFIHPQQPAQVGFQQQAPVFPTESSNYYFARSQQPELQRAESPSAPSQQTGPAVESGSGRTTLLEASQAEQPQAPLPAYGPVSFQSGGRNIDVPDFSSLGQFISPEQAQQILQSVGQFTGSQEQQPLYQQAFPNSENMQAIIVHQIPAFSQPLPNNILINPSDFAPISREETPDVQYGLVRGTSVPSPTTGQAETAQPALRSHQGEESHSFSSPQPQSYNNQQPDSFANAAYAPVQSRESTLRQQSSPVQIGYLYPQQSSDGPQPAYGIESLNLNEIPNSSPKPIYGIPLAPVLGLESFSPSASPQLTYASQEAPSGFSSPFHQNFHSNQISSQYEPLPTSYGVPSHQQLMPFSTSQFQSDSQQVAPALQYQQPFPEQEAREPEEQSQNLSWDSRSQASLHSNQDNIESELPLHGVTAPSQIYGLRTSLNNNKLQRQPALQEQSAPQFSQPQGGYSSRYPRRSRRIVRKNVARKTTTTTTESTT